MLSCCENFAKLNMIVYKIINSINECIYIGITTRSLEERWREHLLKYAENNPRHLYQAMHKYGVENFQIVEIERVNSYAELCEKEQFYISKYDSLNHGYNMTEGGEVNPMENADVKSWHDEKMRSANVRQRISTTMKDKATRGELFSPEHKKRISDASKNHTYLYKEKRITHVKSTDISKIDHLIADGWLIYKRGITRVPPGLNPFDTRSCALKCELSDGSTRTFVSYKTACEWWFEFMHPCGNHYSLSTLKHKIKDSINGRPMYFKRADGTILQIEGIRWYNN